jgi:hypothetical protein
MTFTIGTTSRHALKIQSLQVAKQFKIRVTSMSPSRCSKWPVRVTVSENIELTLSSLGLQKLIQIEVIYENTMYKATDDRTEWSRCCLWFCLTEQ